MFHLDIDLKLSIEVSDNLNERLEAGAPTAFLELESMLIFALQYHNFFKVFRLQIEDAGPYNDAGQWGPSKFHE